MVLCVKCDLCSQCVVSFRRVDFDLKKYYIRETPGPVFSLPFSSAITAANQFLLLSRRNIGNPTLDDEDLIESRITTVYNQTYRKHITKTSGGIGLSV